jgi:FixJ family two-component response regulator
MHNMVYVVDDDDAVRRGLRRQLESAGYRVKLFENAEQFFEQPEVDEIACLILDVKMPGTSGPDMHRRLVESGRLLPVILLSGHVDVPTSVAAMKRGAVDVLLKPADDEALLGVVAAALARSREERENAAETRRAKEKIERLSVREFEVFRKVISGALNKQIARDLGVVEQTIKFHRSAITQKLDVDSVAEMVRLAGRAGVQPA